MNEAVYAVMATLGGLALAAMGFGLGIDFERARTRKRG